MPNHRPPLAERRGNAAARTVALLGLLAYLLLSLNRLAVFPPVGQDEPWIAGAPYKLATQGVLGLDLFTGYYGMERHHYQHMPVYPLLQAATFKLFGVGVVQMRALPVAFGFLLLVTAFVVGRQAGDDRVGALAVVLLLTLRMTAGGDATGILLLDRARINRYDIAVPVFGLLALWAFNHAERRRLTHSTDRDLIGLSSLTLWTVLAAGLCRPVDRAPRRRPCGSATCSCCSPDRLCLPWILRGDGLVRIISARCGWCPAIRPLQLTSTRTMSCTEQVISLDWSVRTIRAMPFYRIGTWTMLLGVPAGVAAIARTGRRSPVSALAVVSVTQFVMFVVLLKVKSFNYMIALWPLGALLLAWFGIWLWDRRMPMLRLALMTLAALTVTEGTMRIAHAQRSAREATPYDFYEAEVASCIPPGSLVLGLQNYWLGLRQYQYRSWVLPIDLSYPGYYHEPMSLDQALERVNPGVILVDRYIDDLMKKASDPASPNHQQYIGFEAFRARRRMTPICLIDDHTYGAMQVYRVPAPVSPR